MRVRSDDGYYWWIEDEEGRMIEIPWKSRAGSNPDVFFSRETAEKALERLNG